MNILEEVLNKIPNRLSYAKAYIEFLHSLQNSLWERYTVQTVYVTVVEAHKSQRIL